MSSAREGSQDVAALVGAVSESGEGLAGRAVDQGKVKFAWLDAGGEPVEGHTHLGPEARCDAG